MTLTCKPGGPVDADAPPASARPSVGGRRAARRHRALGSLNALSGDVSLISIVAPAGYGKTTLLGQWADEDDRGFAWVQVTESDNDPALLRRHVDGAVKQSRPPWVLVLDDAHLLHHGDSLAVVISVVSTLPMGCAVVVASRTRPDLDLSRLPDGVRCAEFGPEDLSLTVQEVEAVVAGAGLDLHRRAVAALRARTQGWPAGTYLAALSIAGSTDADAAAAAIGGGDAFIADYFRDEVLSREPAEIVRFLMQTSPLEQMTASLCDAVLERSGSATWLAEIERRNLFVTGPDGDRRWYRYHRLFAEMLRSELERREPGEEQRVHRLAAAWYDAQGQPAPAVQHAFSGQDRATAARLVGRYAGRMVNEGRAEVAQQWLKNLDGGALKDHPALAIEAGWIWALAGNAELAGRCLLAAEAGAEAAGQSVEGGRLTAGTAALRTALAPQGVEGMVRDARLAVARQSSAGPDRARPAVLLGVAYLLNGDADAGARELERAAALGRRGRSREALFALAQLSLLAAEAADWKSAADYASEAGGLVDQSRFAVYASGAPTHAARARVALHHGDLTAARHSVDRALRWYAKSSLAAFPWLGAQMAITLGSILLELNDDSAAEIKAAEARRYLARLPTVGILGGRYELFAAGLDGRADVQTSTLTTAEMRILDLLPTHLTLAEIADRLYISRNTVKFHVAAVYRKLNATTRTQAVQEGRTNGLIEP